MNAVAAPGRDLETDPDKVNSHGLTVWCELPVAASASETVSGSFDYAPITCADKNRFDALRSGRQIKTVAKILDIN